MMISGKTIQYIGLKYTKFLIENSIGNHSFYILFCAGFCNFGIMSKNISKEHWHEVHFLKNDDFWLNYPRFRFKVSYINFFIENSIRNHSFYIQFVLGFLISELWTKISTCSDCSIISKIRISIKTEWSFYDSFRYKLKASFCKIYR